MRAVIKGYGGIKMLKSKMGKTRVKADKAASKANDSKLQEQYKKEQDEQVAKTILSQLRTLNPRFHWEYALKKLWYIDDGLRLELYKDQKYQKIDIKLNSKDLYDVEFHKIKGLDVKTDTVNDVYAEDLDRIIRNKIFGDVE